jgi:hypothetical protein
MVKRLLMHRSLFAATLAVACSSIALAQDYPKMKAGLWEMTSTAAKEGVPPAKSSLCTDDALQKELVTMGAGIRKEMCAKSDLKRDGNRITSTAECKLGESKIVSRAVMTLKGDSAYTTDVTATYDPPFMGMRETRTTLEGKWIGPCKDGMAPGDFITPNGQKINLKTMASGQMSGAAASPPPAPQPK